MANNPILFNAALAGAFAGINTSRSLVSAVGADYTAQRTSAFAFATLLDGQIAAAGTFTQQDANVLGALVQQVVSGKGESAANLTTINAIIAAWVFAIAVLDPAGASPTNPVYIEDYMNAAGGDLRTAIVAAHTANTAPGTTFILPRGEFPWVGIFFSPRNYTHWEHEGCTIYQDVAGIATGQIIFFFRNDTGVGTSARGITHRNGVFELRNALTSYFGYAIGYESAADCIIENCTATCTLDAAATTGRTRWGFSLFGGDRVADPTCGRNNRFLGCTLNLAQIQGCGGARSVNGVTIKDTIAKDANDLAISVVSTGATKSVENVSIINTLCENVAGSGVVFAGSDGAGTGIGAGIVRNILIDGVWLNGARPIDLDFPLIAAITMDGGLVTENVVITNVGTQLTSTELNSRSILVQSQDDETSWFGLEINKFSLGVVTTNDPLGALFISGRNIKGMNISNGNVVGLRGIRIVDCDDTTINGLSMENGQLLYIANARNLDGIVIGDCNFVRTTGAEAPILFSATGENFSKVLLSNIILDGNNVPITTALGGGTMQMWMENIDDSSSSNPTAETLAGIIRVKNIRGFIVPVVLSVVVPALAATVTDYVDVPMAGTRLADIAVGEDVVVTPSADLAAAGAAGGYYVNARVSATGTVRLLFVGTLAGGASNFNFDRAG